MYMDKYDSKHTGSCINIQANKNIQTEGKYMRIIGPNNKNHGVVEHCSLFSHMNACIDTGDIIGMNSRIDTGDLWISLVQY